MRQVERADPPVVRDGGDDTCPDCGHERDAQRRRSTPLRQLLGIRPARARCGQASEVYLEQDGLSFPCGCRDVFHGS